MPAGIACGLRACMVRVAAAERGVQMTGSGRADCAARRYPLRVLALAVLALGAMGCSHLKWPWHHQPTPPPAPVHVLDVSGTGASAVLAQYWKRNTLVVDITAASGSG